MPDESIANFRKKGEKYLIVKAQTNSEMAWLCESFCWTNPILIFVTALNILMVLWFFFFLNSFGQGEIFPETFEVFVDVSKQNEEYDKKFCEFGAETLPLSGIFLLLLNFQ